MLKKLAVSVPTLMKDTFPHLFMHIENRIYGIVGTFPEQFVFEQTGGAT